MLKPVLRAPIFYLEFTNSCSETNNSFFTVESQFPAFFLHLRSSLILENVCWHTAVFQLRLTLMVNNRMISVVFRGYFIFQGIIGAQGGHGRPVSMFTLAYYITVPLSPWDMMPNAIVGVFVIFRLFKRKKACYLSKKRQLFIRHVRVVLLDP